jgi:hypothetical protein
MSIVLVGSTSGSITLQEPAIAGTTVLDLPATSGTILTSASAISASSITTGTLPKAQLPTGSVLQVVSTTKTDTYTQNSNTFTDITGYSVTITPTSASNKILVMCTLNICSVTGYNLIGRLMRDSTPIFIGDAAGSRPRAAFENFFLNSETAYTIPVTFLDSPNTTSAITYKFQVKSGQTIYVNRNVFDRDTVDFDARMASSITVMEIAG